MGGVSRLDTESKPLRPRLRGGVDARATAPGRIDQAARGTNSASERQGHFRGRRGRNVAWARSQTAAADASIGNDAELGPPPKRRQARTAALVGPLSRGVPRDWSVRRPEAGTKRPQALASAVSSPTRRPRLWACRRGCVMCYPGTVRTKPTPGLPRSMSAMATSSIAAGGMASILSRAPWRHALL